MQKNGLSHHRIDSLEEIDRRSLLAGVSGVLGAATAVGALGAHQSAAAEERIKTQPANQSFKQGELNGEPWVADKHGNFDLTDPREHRLATFKITNNLIGAKTYIPMISRALLGPQGKGGAPLFGHVGLWTWQLQVPNKDEYPDAPEGSIVQRAMYTGMILDPQTYEPVETVYNKYLDKDVAVEDSLFAESYVFYPLGGGEATDREGFMDEAPEEKKKLRPIVRWGDDVQIYLDGIFTNEGPHQPRMDCSIWTTSYKDFVNPKKRLNKTDYNFAGLMRAWEREWIGIDKSDDTQLLWNVKGTKMHSVDEFPELALKTLIAKYPDRI